MSLRIGVVILPDLSWEQSRARWKEAEQRGFHTAWTYDHLSWRTLRDGPWLGAVPLLAAAAECTTTLRLGTLVTSPNFRHPALLAKDVMTIDQISGGRFELGIGAGGPGWDATALGGPAPTFPERAARFEDFTAALDVMLREPSGTYSGDMFQAPEYRTLPGCVQRPRVPFTVAAFGPRALAVAAEHGECWVTFGPAHSADTGDAWFDGVQEQFPQARRGLLHARTRSLPRSGAWRWSGSRPAGQPAPVRAGPTSPAVSPPWASPTSSCTGPDRQTLTCPAVDPAVFDAMSAAL